MKCYLDKTGNYYEGDRQSDDQEVPQRPDAKHVWNGSEWVPMPPTLEDARRAADATDAAEAKADAQVQMFLNFTLAQLDTWVETNITGAGNKTAFKVLGRLAQAAARGKVLR